MQNDCNFSQLFDIPTFKKTGSAPGVNPECENSGRTLRNMTGEDGRTSLIDIGLLSCN